MDKPASSPPAESDLPLAGGCPLFHDGSALSALQGARGSVTLADGSLLWTFSSGVLTSGTAVSNGVALTTSATSVCSATATATTAPMFAPSPLNSDYLLAPLDLVRADNHVWSYYQAFQLDSTQPFGVRSVGFGIAERDEASGQFQPSANLLWPGDGPSYGGSALILDTDLYVYGCRDSSCYVAKTSLADLDDPAGYTYATGADRFSGDPNAARPILNGTGEISLRRHISGRLLATYVPPLGGTLMVRSALGPAGPFSNEYELARCELGTGDFCVGAIRHPEQEVDTSSIAISYVAASFDGASPPDRYWPKLAILKLPPELP